MLYILASPAPSFVDRFLEGILAQDSSFRKVVVDDFTDEDVLHRRLASADSLFGEKLVFVFVNFPKTRLTLLDRLWANHQPLRLVLAYTGERAEKLGKVLSWVAKRGGIVKRATGAPPTIFRFLDAFSRRDIAVAIRLLRLLESEGGNVFLVLSFLHTRIEKLLLAKAGGDVPQKIARYSQPLPLSLLFAWQEQLLFLEHQVRNSLGDPWERLEQWLLSCCGDLVGD